MKVLEAVKSDMQMVISTSPTPPLCHFAEALHHQMSPRISGTEADFHDLMTCTHGRLICRMQALFAAWSGINPSCGHLSGLCQDVCGTGKGEHLGNSRRPQRQVLWGHTCLQVCQVLSVLHASPMTLPNQCILCLRTFSACWSPLYHLLAGQKLL